MDSVKLCVMLLATDCVLALDCNWQTHYEYKERCCKICPSGQFPMQPCSNHSEGVCTECKENSVHCFCNNKLCEDRACSTCSHDSPRCVGELRRTGQYKFGYICKLCPNETYFNETDKMCKPILDCGKLGRPVIFPGNKTHNARCGIQVSYLAVHAGMFLGLAITSSVCLAMLIYLCIQRTKEQRMKKKYPPTSNALKVPSDEYGCKLSKEEIGEVLL